MTPHTVKTALVTGAAHRIGRAIAIDLAAQGWAVGVHYRDSRAEAEAVVAMITAAGGRAVAIAADLAQEREVTTLIARTGDALGPLTALVNNASRFEYDNVTTADRASWDAHLEINVRAPLVLTQAFARQLPDDQSGAVVNILDQRVWNLTPHFLSYTVSKSALWTLTQTLALALAPRIRVNAIGPGPTLPSARQSAEHFERQWQSLPLSRPTNVHDICDGVRFLLAAQAMTGQMIALDGGEHLAWAQPKQGLVPSE
ncbi:MAG: SDR family oxidoreductase [Azospirillaceae bacterium]|nr:SDR family oxidoreductase [Azospirillaceae bacterium]